jgi:hypothetical protein
MPGGDKILPHLILGRIPVHQVCTTTAAIWYMYFKNGSFYVISKIFISPGIHINMAAELWNIAWCYKLAITAPCQE